MKILEIIERALAFFDAPESGTLDLDGLERELRAMHSLISSGELMLREGTLDDSGDQRKKEAELTRQIAALEERIGALETERLLLRDHVARKIRGFMKTLGYPETEIRDAEETAEADALLKTEERIRKEFDRRFRMEPLVQDTPEKQPLNLLAYKVG